MNKIFKFDVVCPHLNYDGLRKSLESLRRNTPKENLGKVILIDQNETYQDVDDLVDIHIKCDNLGFAKALNTGIRLSDSEYVACMNDDVEILNPHWVEGIEQTFKDYSTALCVNPSSVCDPDGAGGKKIMDGFEYKENYSDEEYNKLLNPGVIDGICYWFPFFNRNILDNIKGVVPGKAWFDEKFRYGGGDDYDMNRRGYLSGFRSLGTGKSYVWHHWHKTKHPISGEEGAKDDSTTWLGKWGVDADLYGNTGDKNVPLNIIR